VKISTSISPPYSLVLVVGSSNVDHPIFSAESVISATKNCIAIGCKSEDDGETKFILGAIEEINQNCDPDAKFLIETPNHELRVQTVYGKVILQIDVRCSRTDVSIWLNDENEPTIVWIGVSICENALKS
jgi:hypothetical protein